MCCYASDWWRRRLITAYPPGTLFTCYKKLIGPHAIYGYYQYHVGRNRAYNHQGQTLLWNYQYQEQGPCGIHAWHRQGGVVYDPACLRVWCDTNNLLGADENQAVFTQVVITPEDWRRYRSGH